MPFKYDNRPINKELHNLIIDRDLSYLATKQMFESLISRGANPFATLSMGGGNINLFLEALYLEQEEMVEWMLAYSVESGNPIDLSEACPMEPESTAPMSWMHYAIFRSDVECLDKLRSHQDMYHPKDSFENIINKQFYYNFQSQKKFLKTTTWSVLFWSVTLKVFLSNFIAIGNGADQAPDFILEWMDLPATDPLNKQLDQNVVFRLKGHVKMLQSLLDNNLILDETRIDHNNQTIRTVANRFKEAYSVAQLWNTDIKPNLEATDRVELGEAIQGDGGILIDTNFTNLVGAQLFKRRVCPAYNAMIVLALNALDIQNRARLESAATGGAKSKQVQQLTETVATHSRQINDLTGRVTKIEVDLAEFGRKLNSIAKIQRDEIRAKLEREPFYLDMFNNLYGSCASVLRQTSDRKFGVFKAAPSKQDQMAHNLLNVFSVALQACPVTPFASAIPALVGVLWDWRSDVNKAVQSNAAFKNTLSFEAEDLATCLAAFLTAEAMNAHGKNADQTYKVPNAKVREHFVGIVFKQVEAQIGTMSQLKGHDPMDLICHLAAKAVPSLQAIKAANDSPNADNVVLFRTPTPYKNNASNGSGGSQSTRTQNTSPIHEMDVPRLAITNSSGSSNGKNLPPKPAYALAASQQRTATEVPKQLPKTKQPPKKKGIRCVMM